MCPIWPEVTPEKADLFNKYGRGIVHMGLHIGTKGFKYDRNKSRKKPKVIKPVNVMEVNMLLDEIEAAIGLDAFFVARAVKGIAGAGSMYAFNGTGDDWQAVPNFKLYGDFGLSVLVEADCYVNASVLNQFMKLGVLINGVLDMETVVRFRYTSGTEASGFKMRIMLRPGAGEHTFQLAFVYENATTARIEQRSSWFRLVGLKIPEE